MGQLVLLPGGEGRSLVSDVGVNGSRHIAVLYGHGNGPRLAED